MKIAQIGVFPLNGNIVKGGIEASVFGLTNILSKEHDLFVFDSPRNSIQYDYVEKNNSITINRYFGKNNNFRSLKRVKKIVEDIENIEPDFCHIHGTGYLQNKLYKELISKNLNVIVTIHGLQYVEKKKELKRKFSFRNLIKYILLSKSEFEIIEKSDQIIVDTKYVEEQIIKYKEHRKIKKLPKIFVIPQGIDEGYFSLKNNPHTNTLLCVGAISKRKGQINLLKSFQEISRNNSEIELIIAGFIAEQDYYHKLYKEVLKRGLNDKVTILTENTQQDIYQLYEKSSIFVLYTAEESQGIVFAEAMAVGMPVVSTNVGGVSYVIENSVNGFLSEYNNLSSFTKNLNLLIANKSLYNDISLKNIETAQKYRWETISKCIYKLYSNQI